MSLSFSATPSADLAGTPRPAGSKGARVRAPLAGAGLEALPEPASSDPLGFAVVSPLAAGADAVDAASDGLLAPWAVKPARAGGIAPGVAVSTGASVVARGVEIGR
jgi:hypothetical protein